MTYTVEDTFLLPYGFCRRMDLKALSSQMYFKFWNFDGVSYQVFMTSPMETTDISISKASMQGDAIINGGNSQMRQFFMINLIEAKLS